jgi:TRAP transporter TAXI family solute receptor
MSKRELHPAFKIWIPVALLIVASAFVALRFAEAPPPKSLKFAAGGKTGAYYANAERYQAAFKKEAPRIAFEVLETGGSIENIKKLEAGEVDLAFVQGGTAVAASPNSTIRSLASVYYEPIWLFYAEKGEAGRAELLSDLRGRRIGVGLENSGTWPVARQLLEINGVTRENSTYVHLGMAEAESALLSGEVDASFFIASPEAPVIRKLISAVAAGPDAAGRSVRLLNFRRYRAYARNFPFLKEIVIPEGLFDLARNVPPRDIILLATTATLCAREDLHPGIAQLMLKVATELHGKQGTLEAAGEFPSKHYVEFPPHESAKSYLENGPSWLSRNLPFWAVSLVNRLKILLLPLLTLLLPAMKLVPVLYRFSMNKRIYRWYNDLSSIETSQRSPLSASRLQENIDKLAKLERDVSKISVPASFRKDVYNLRVHIQLVSDRARERHAEALEAEKSERRGES